MIRTTVLALIASTVAISVISPVEAQEASEEAVAIVVHPDVAIDNLSLGALKSIFLGEQQHWSDHGSRSSCGLPLRLNATWS
jgi:ABC-type phosphate transport system substrate-binding protein